MYSDKVMDHFTNPRNVGEVTDADGVGTVGNPACGDIMKLTIKVEGGVIKDVKFKTFGCGSAIASTSMLSVMVTENDGMLIDEALKITPKHIMERLEGLPNRKIHCSVLAEDALKAALEDYYKKQRKKE